MKSVYKYNINDFNYITCVQDFFDEIYGLNEEMAEFDLDRYNVFMSRNSCNKLYDFMIRNINEAEVSKTKWEILCSHDWVTNSPLTSKKEVPDNEVWLEW